MTERLDTSEHRICISSVHRIFTRIGYVLVHKTSLSEFERIQVTQNMNNGIEITC